ncbi:hypothetical protein AVDCRST_MAG94-4638 [uncultured Leptolyngbya sp.]|uniref:Uncharacterized protein n=1 Tax=uncultured Leptolyngbya sp. TaxID=332963 RepID=A0A6J4N7W1_9CYAN|nr:hypothetical protein AVDCRST_MAG94-4638 [uncultured Leptolyngbya sp.]
MSLGTFTQLPKLQRFERRYNTDKPLNITVQARFLSILDVMQVKTPQHLSC